MYTRVVELTTKPDKARELCTTIDDKVRPIRPTINQQRLLEAEPLRN